MNQNFFEKCQNSPNSLETVCFLFETYNEISGNADCCPKKIKTEKLLTFNFSTFFSVV